MPSKRSAANLFLTLLVLVLAVASQQRVQALESTLVNHLHNWSLWTRGDTAYSFGLDPLLKFRGQSCAFIKANQPDPTWPQGAIYQKFRADSFRGKRVCLTGWIKTAGVKDFAGLWMVVHGPERAVAFDNMENRAARGTHDWKQYSIVLDVPDDGRSIMVGFMLHGNGKAWLSGLTLAPVDKNVKTTNLAIDELKFPMEGRYGERPTFTFRLPRKGALGGQAPADWGAKNGSDYEIVVDDLEKYNDKNSARIYAIKEDPKSFATIWQTISARDYSAQRWRFSGAIKTKSVSDCAALWMRVDGGGKVMRFDDMEDRPINGTTDWKRYSVVLDIPKNSYSIKFGFLQSGVGSSWISDCTFEKVGDDVKTTGKPMEPIEIPDPDVKPSPQLGFE
jgi:hypothetical protein